MSDKVDTETLRGRIPEKYARIGVFVGMILMVVGLLGAMSMVGTGEEGEPIWNSEWNPEDRETPETSVELEYKPWMALIGVSMVGMLLTASMIELSDHDR